MLASARDLTLAQEHFREVAELASDLAEAILHESRARETPEQTNARRALSQLLDSPESQLFTTALTDRVHRATSATAAVRVLRDLLQRTGGGKHFPAVDRLQMRAARMFGPLVPKLTQKALLHRLSQEARPYLWDAADEKLSQSLSFCHAAGAKVNLNYLGEEVLGHDEATERLKAYVSLASRNDIDALSLKLSAIEPHLEIRAPDEMTDRLCKAVVRVAAAGQKRASGPPLLYFDMETYQDLAITVRVVVRLLEDLPRDARIGVALQAYLPESLAAVHHLAKASAARTARGGVPLRIRLVKGANLQMERVISSLHRWAVPVFPEKSLVDAHFKRVLRSCAREAAQGHVALGVGSHNLFDVAYALLLREIEGLGDRLQIEMLEGMAGTEGEVVSELSGGILVYAPAVHENNFSSAVSYLVRRLDENTAPENFMRDAPRLVPGDAAFLQQRERFLEAVEESYSDPPITYRTQNRAAEAHDGVPSAPLSEPFDNAADTDFTREANRQHLDRHLALLAADDSIVVEPLIAGEAPKYPRKTTTGFDPSRPRASYSIVLSSGADIETAITTASEYAPYFLATKTRRRAELLENVAELLEKNRARLTAAMVLDAGKRVQEADIEVSEAVDFARYYARRALELEDNLDPRGVTVVTPPWNFPLAIPLGGVLAALVAGNTVILKPAPETPLVAYLAVQLCHQAGIPRQALAFVPCLDEDAGKLIVDPRVRAVILTGGTETAQLFKKMRPDLTLLAETGGKNGAYVAPVSDREQAIAEIVRSAFGHSGQKCSALSLLVLSREVFEDEGFRRTLVDATRSLPVGSAWDPMSIVTPLIHPPSGALRQIIEQGDRYGKWLLAPKMDERNPRLLSPGILWGVEPGSFPHQTEFFGPILSVMCAEDLDEALKILGSTRYGLTAGLFSLEESDHERFVEGIEAGNVYINRGITGAVVGRQPFGGHKESSFGPGAKAGGPDYVRQMTVCRASSARAKELLENRENDYDASFRNHFQGVALGTEVVGEENYLRYLPGRTVVVIGEGAEAMDIRFALKARRLCRNDYPLMLLRGHGSTRTEQILGAERVGSITASGGEIVTRAKGLGAERLRVVGAPSDDLLQAAAEERLTVITDPVSDVGTQELLLYLRPQSISCAFHRHGNTSFYRLSRLKEALSYWERADSSRDLP